VATSQAERKPLNQPDSDWKDHDATLAASSSYQGYKEALVVEFQRAYGWDEKEVRLVRCTAG
jgi:hypothetical protein